MVMFICNMFLGLRRMYLQEHMRVLHSGSIQYDFGYEICNLWTQKDRSLEKDIKKWLISENKKMLFLFKGWLKFIISVHFCHFLKKVNVSFIRFFKIYWNTKESFTPLYKQIIALQKFNIPISIDISIKTHQFVCIRQALSEFYILSDL